jgi:hypothetical protein
LQEFLKKRLQNKKCFKDHFFLISSKLKKFQEKCIFEPLMFVFIQNFLKFFSPHHYASAMQSGGGAEAPLCGGGSGAEVEAGKFFSSLWKMKNKKQTSFFRSSLLQFVYSLCRLPLRTAPPHLRFAGRRWRRCRIKGVKIQRKVQNIFPRV